MFYSDSHFEITVIYDIMQQCLFSHSFTPSEKLSYFQNYQSRNVSEFEKFSHECMNYWNQWMVYLSHESDQRDALELVHPQPYNKVCAIPLAHTDCIPTWEDLINYTHAIFSLRHSEFGVYADRIEAFLADAYALHPENTNFDI